MTPDQIKNFEQRQAENERIRKMLDHIYRTLNLKPGSFFALYDSRGFVVINLHNTVENTTRILKVSEMAEILIDTQKYYSVHQSGTKKDLLFFSELKEIPVDFSTTRQGILDENFEVILPALYDSIRYINDAFFEVSTENYLGVLNARFEVIIPLKYREIEYNKTLNIFKAREQINEEGHTIYRIYDQNGALIKTLEYGLVNFTESHRFYTIYDIEIPYDSYVDDSVIIGRQGLLDQNFKTLIPPLYDLIFKGDKYIMVYEQRNAILGHDYESEEPLGSESYYTLDGGKWGVFDHENNLVIPFQYNWIEPTFSDELFLINPTGLMYYYRGEQEDGAWYVKKGHWGLINAKNEVIVAPVYKYNNFYTDKIVFFNKKAPDQGILDLEDALTIHF